LSSENGWNVVVNGEPVTHTIDEDTDNTNIYFTYNHSIKTVEIIGTNTIPEFPSWITLSLFMAATISAVMVYRRLTKKASKS